MTQYRVMKKRIPGLDWVNYGVAYTEENLYLFFTGGQTIRLSISNLQELDGRHFPYERHVEFGWDAVRDWKKIEPFAPQKFLQDYDAQGSEQDEARINSNKYMEKTNSKITFITFGNQKLTPAFLTEIVSPYFVAIADIQKVIDEIHNDHKNEVVVRSITQNPPISVSLDGASEAIRTVQETVITWRRENAKKLAQLLETEKGVAIEVLKAETLERRANAAKSRAEAEKILSEAEKQRQETEQLRLGNEKIRIEIERAKVQLALDILDRIDSNIPATEKISYVVKLLPPLDVISFSKLEIIANE